MHIESAITCPHCRHQKRNLCPPIDAYIITGANSAAKCCNPNLEIAACSVPTDRYPARLFNSNAHKTAPNNSWRARLVCLAAANWPRDARPSEASCCHILRPFSQTTPIMARPDPYGAGSVSTRQRDTVKALHGHGTITSVAALSIQIIPQMMRLPQML